MNQDYESFILSPEGSFLIAFKPQYEEDELLTPENKVEAEVAGADTTIIPKLPENNDTDNANQCENENEEESKDKDTDNNQSAEPKEAPKKTPTERIQLHAYLLSEKRKLSYRIHSESMTGYETENEQKMSEDNKEELDSADNILLPKKFNIDNVKLDRLSIKLTKNSKPLLCAITNNGQLLYHPMLIQVSEKKLKLRKSVKKRKERKITKLDYMEYMVEKFGSRAAVFHPRDGKLYLHTTYIITDECKDAKVLCNQIAKTICKSLYDKEKKDFKYLSWKNSSIQINDKQKLSGKSVLKAIKNKKSKIKSDIFIKNLIVQIPIQIARGVPGKF